MSPQGVEGAWRPLALFPLGTVLFPDGLLPLRVFEARYTDLVSNCLREGSAFGAVTLNALGSSWTGQGTLYDTVANTCGGAPLPTSVEIALSVDNVGPSADQTTLHAGQISGTLTFASGETEQCGGAGRAATFGTAPVGSAG